MGFEVGGKKLDALSIGGPGMAMRLQNPFAFIEGEYFAELLEDRLPPWPAWTFFNIIVKVLVSMRQAGHWPQDSAVKNSEIFKTSSTMQVPSGIKRTTPQPSAEPASRIELWIERRVDLVRLTETPTTARPA